MSGQFRDFQDDDKLLRAVLKKSYLESLPDAFLLRDDERETGLSVMYDCDVKKCRDQFNRSYGVAELLVAVPVSLELRVVPDSLDHANIVGIPHKEDNPDQAEWIASQLAAQATLIDRGKVEKPK